jgi:hypothetical protein
MRDCAPSVTLLRRKGFAARLAAWRHAVQERALRKEVNLASAHGAALDDPAGLSNACLDGKVRQAINIAKTNAVDDADSRRLIATPLSSVARASRRLGRDERPE